MSVSTGSSSTSGVGCGSGFLALIKCLDETLTFRAAWPDSIECKVILGCQTEPETEIDGGLF